MLLRELQGMLARFYRLDVAADVSDYLVTDPQLLSRLHTDTLPSPDETLLIATREQSLEVALYLQEEMLARLIESNPCADLLNSNLDDFCKVLEGVSHFVCLAWNAGKDKSVTRLELELQAELDKYVGARLLLESQANARLSGAQLRAVLFGAVRYRDELAADELERYRQANSMVGRYCNSLEQRFPAAGVTAAMAAELRAFYRMSQPEKFSHMRAAQFA